MAGNPSDRNRDRLRQVQIRGLQGVAYVGAIPAIMGIRTVMTPILDRSDFIVVQADQVQLRWQCTRSEQRRALELPGRNVLMLLEAFDPLAAALRPWELNALVVASRGRGSTPQRLPCVHCVACAARSPHHYPSPFVDCFRLDGYFNGCCATCLWSGDPGGCTYGPPEDGDGDPVPVPAPVPAPAPVPNLPPPVGPEGLAAVDPLLLSQALRCLRIAANTGHGTIMPNQATVDRGLVLFAGHLTRLLQEQAASRPIPADDVRGRAEPGADRQP